MSHKGLDFFSSQWREMVSIWLLICKKRTTFKFKTEKYGSGFFSYHSATWTSGSSSSSLSLTQTNKRRGTAPIEPGKRGAAGGGGGERRAERRDGRREGGLEGWVQVPLASRREELQAARELASTSLRSSRTTTPHHKTRCVPGNDPIYILH